MAAKTFREIFLTYNKPWLQGQLHEVFTPRTLFLHRRDIIEQFRAVMGELAADVTLSDQPSSRSRGSDRSGETEQASQLDSEGRAGKDKARKHRKDGTPYASGATTPRVGPRGMPLEQERAQLRAGMSAATAAIARYWLTRTRFISTLKVQVQAIVDLHIEDECLYCGATGALQAEVAQDIEQLFHRFLRETGEANNLPNYKFQRWIRFFKAQARFRPLCPDCTGLIQDYHRKLARRARRAGEPPPLEVAAQLGMSSNEPPGRTSTPGGITRNFSNLFNRDTPIGMLFSSQTPSAPKQTEEETPGMRVYYPKTAAGPSQTPHYLPRPSPVGTPERAAGREETSRGGTPTPEERTPIGGTTVGGKRDWQNDDAFKAAWLERIRNLSPEARAIIDKWVWLMRASMHGGQ